jgi:hypothetical protein
MFGQSCHVAGAVDHTNYHDLAVFCHVVDRMPAVEDNPETGREAPRSGISLSGSRVFSTDCTTRVAIASEASSAN